MMKVLILLISFHLLFQTQVFAIELDKIVDHSKYGQNTFFHVVVIIVNGNAHFSWSPANNIIGPGTKRANWYNWATDQNGKEIPVEKTTTGNGGHSQLVNHMISKFNLSESFFGKNGLSQAVETLKEDILKISATIVESGGNKDYLFHGGVVDGSLKNKYFFSSPDGSEVVDVTEVVDKYSESKRKLEKDLIDELLKGKSIKILGGGFIIKEEEGRRKAVVKITSRSSNWRIILKPNYKVDSNLGPTLSAFVNMPISLVVPSLNISNVKSKEQSGSLEPEYINTFVKAMRKIIPNLDIEISPKDYFGVDAEKKLEIIKSIQLHNNYKSSKCSLLSL